MSFERVHVIGAGLSAVFAWLLITSAIPSLRWIPYALITGFLVAVAIALWIFFTTVESLEALNRRSRTRLVPAFVRASQWEDARTELRLRSDYRKRALFSGRKDLSTTFDKLLDLILGTFVTSWYTNISRKPLFQNQIDHAIRDAITSIEKRIADIDFTEVAVSRIVPLITTHMQEFYTAERLVRGKNLTRDMTESEELDLAIASKYQNGRLHKAATLTFADTKLMQQAHVRKSVEKILPLVMAEDMLSSAAVLALVREIVACAVLIPILLLLADPDTWNNLVESFGRSILQDRKNVRKLRAALDEHAPSSPRGQRKAEVPRLRPHDSERHFERFIRALRKASTLAEARRYRNEIISQVRKGVDNTNADPLYLRRLDAGRRILDQRIESLVSHDAAHPPRPKASSKSSSPNIDSSVYAHTSLKDILHNATGLSYFMEFMDRKNKMRLVQFWIIVDGFRNPLEDDPSDAAEISSHEKMSYNSAERMDIRQIRDSYLGLPELSISSKSRKVVDTFVDAGKGADVILYAKARRAILRAQTAVFEEMRERHFDAYKRSDLFYKWRAAEDQKQPAARSSLDDTVSKDVTRPARPQSIQALRQSSAHIQTTRKDPELRRAVVSSSDLLTKAKMLSPELSRRSIDDQTSRPLFDDDVEDERMTKSVPSLGAADSDTDSVADHNRDNHDAVDAMQRELNSIVDEPEKDLTLSDPNIRSVLFDDSPRSPDELFDTASYRSVKPSIASLGLIAGPSSSGVFADDLFGHEEQKYLEDEKDDPEQRPVEDEIQEAAPGDLGLTEAIDVLNNDVERLVAQENIVDSLTKKAELTNNAAELRILRKSKQSLQREIRRKEMQKQQYVVQESDNSLYGRAAVNIKSIMVGKDDDGHEYAIYVIEVRRQAGDHMPAAAWTIARRYSEFHDLNKRLRARFEAVRDLEFPRRQTLFTLQKDFLQRRRLVLERYLRSLLLIPAICRSRELRAFLSQSAIVSTDGTSPAGDSGDLVTRIYNSVSDGMEEFLGNLPVLDQLTVAGQNLISAASAQINGAGPGAPHSVGNITPTTPGLALLANDPTTAAEVEAEMSAFETADSLPFVKPISDLFLELFELQKGNSWLRGRAVVVVLHQLLGGTVERKIRDTTRQLTDEASLVRHVDTLIGIMWPGGQPRPPAEPRSKDVRDTSRREAALVLASLIPDMAGSVVGRANAQAASRKVAAMLNNQRLNTHLVMTLFDEIVGVLFPEVAAALR